MRARVALVIAVFVLAACGRNAVAPSAPSLPLPAEDAVAGLRPLSATELGPHDVAGDALDAGQLGTLLADAGFESAVGRSYSRPRGPVRRVDVRVVRFATDAGAERYLAWLKDHPDDLIGAVDVLPVALPSITTLFLHLPGGCCPHDQSAVLATWRDGRDVIRVIVSGPGADEGTAIDYIASVERWWAAS